MEKNENKKTISNQQQDEDVIDLGKLFKFLFTKFWIILLWTVGFAVLAFVYTAQFVTPEYAATSKIYIVSASKGSVVDLSDLQLGTNLTSDYAELMMNRPMLEDVIKDLNLNVDPEELQEMITIENPSDTREICITATSTNPEEAKDIANDMAAMSIKYLPKIMKTEEPTMVEEALTPVEPVSPSYPKNILIGALLGLVLSAGYYVIRFLSNDVFEEDADILSTFGEMPLASVEMNTDASGKKIASKKTSSKGKKGSGSKNGSSSKLGFSGVSAIKKTELKGER